MLAIWQFVLQTKINFRNLHVNLVVLSFLLSFNSDKYLIFSASWNSAYISFSIQPVRIILTIYDCEFNLGFVCTNYKLYCIFTFFGRNTKKLYSICNGFMYLPDDCSGCIWSIVFNKIFFHSPLLIFPFLYKLNKTLHIVLTNYCISRSLVTACIRFKNSSPESRGYISLLGKFVKCSYWPFSFLSMIDHIAQKITFKSSDALWVPKSWTRFPELWHKWWYDQLLCLRPHSCFYRTIFRSSKELSHP